MIYQRCNLRMNGIHHDLPRDLNLRSLVFLRFNLALNFLAHKVPGHVVLDV